MKTEYVLTTGILISFFFLFLIVLVVCGVELIRFIYRSIITLLAALIITIEIIAENSVDAGLGIYKKN